MSSYFNKDPTQTSNEEADSHNSQFSKLGLYIQQANDKVLFYKKERWIAASCLVILYLVRIFSIGGYYALTYILGIHSLNSFLGFISPLDDPDELDEEQSYLPQR